LRSLLFLLRADAFLRFCDGSCVCSWSSSTCARGRFCQNSISPISKQKRKGRNRTQMRPKKDVQRRNPQAPATKKREHTSKHRRCTLERPLQISLRLASQDIYRHGFRVIQVFEAHDALCEEGLGVAQVAVEAAHHEDAQVCGSELEDEESGTSVRGSSSGWVGDTHQF
jgi:hypothetical protein